MAMVPRTVPVPVTASIHTVRSAAVARSGASEAKPVDELSPQTESRFQSDQPLAAEYNQLQYNSQGGSEDKAPRGQPGPLNKVPTTSKLFADIFTGDLEIGSPGSAAITLPNVKGYTNLVSKAINTYETNAKVISGNIEERGSTLSFLL